MTIGLGNLMLDTQGTYPQPQETQTETITQETASSQRR